jgi:hypothetical protein
MSEILRRWVIMAVDGTSLEEVKAFHREHNRVIVDEVTRHESTPEESLALRAEIDALIMHVRESRGHLPSNQQGARTAPGAQ